MRVEQPTGKQDNKGGKRSVGGQKQGDKGGCLKRTRGGNDSWKLPLKQFVARLQNSEKAEWGGKPPITTAGKRGRVFNKRKAMLTPLERHAVGIVRDPFGINNKGSNDVPSGKKNIRRG